VGNVLQQINDAMTAIVERVRPGLVQISNGRGGRGAGTIWHPDGLIVTNAHVLHHAPPQITLADGHTLPARVVATNGNGDLAALAVATGGLPAIAHPAAWRLRPGHWVVALGHPWGITGAATAGMVIDVSPPPELPHWRGEFIQVGMHLRPGYSGGPLVDGHGCLVGINTMMAGPEVGLAIPFPVVAAFLRRTLGSV
jgi:S1-C subfamily serine protease